MRTPERLAPAALALALGACANSSLTLAPPAPNIPWTPATRADGQIIAGEPAKANAPRSEGYLLPPNPQAAGGMAAGPPIDTSHRYTLAELIDLAESHNPTTRMAWESARNAALAVGIAKAAYLPTLSASVVGAYQTGNTDVTALGAHSDGDSSLHGSISTISAQWLLFDFGERDGVVGATKQVSTIANIAFTAAHQQIIYQVSLAYYAHTAALARAATAHTALDNARSIEAAADARYAQGIGNVVEAAQAHQITAQNGLADIRARGHADNTYMSLIAAIGLSPLVNLQISDVVHRRLSPALREPIEHIVADALARRPDVLSAYAAREASLSKLKAAKAEFLPKIFLSATGSYASTSFDVTTLPGFGQQPSTINVAGNHWSGTLLLGVTVPLYDGGTRRALEEQAHAEAARSDAALERVRDEATREVIAAGNDLRTSLAALEASEALASAAQITFDAALDAYRGGVGSVTDVARSETALLEARNASTDAYSAALTSAATLALSAGTLGAPPE
jgi:outer membrane protein TolC